MTVEPKIADYFFEKICRAVFFNHVKTHFLGDIQTLCTHVARPGTDFKKWIRVFKEFEPMLPLGAETSGDVFSYRFSAAKDDMTKGFAITATFYETATLFGFGVEADSPAQK